MYVMFGNGLKCEGIRNLSFGVEADLYGESLPINMISMDAIADDVAVGMSAVVRDDVNVIWFFGWVTYSEEVDSEFKHIEISSPLKGLDEHTLKQRMVLESDGKKFGELVDELIYGCISDWMPDETTFSIELPWSIIAPENIRNRVVYGYFPEQSARERLLWYCTSVGVYVRDYFPNSYFCIAFVPYDYTPNEYDIFYQYMKTNVAFVDSSRVFWKPTISFMNYVTAVEVKYYTYRLATDGISRLDEYVDILKEGIDPDTANPNNPENFDTYIQYSNTFRLDNPNIPPKTPENVVTVDQMTCVNGNNVNQIAIRLAMYYFNRNEVNMDLVNNGDVLAGMILMAPIDSERYAVGHVRSTDFSTGVQSRTSITISGAKILDGSDFYDPWNIFAGFDVGKVQIRYLWNGEVIEEGHRFALPIGQPYTVDNPYIKYIEKDNGRTWILRPESEKYSGVTEAGFHVIDVNMYEALDWLDGSLRIVSVDKSYIDNPSDKSNHIVKFE